MKQSIIAAVLFLSAVTSGAEVWEGKKYVNTESKNFDEYMEALGVGYFTRTIGNSVHPTVELKKLPDNKYKLITTSTFKNSEILFEPGKEFDEETLDGRKVKSVMTFTDGNKLVQKQGGKPPSTIVREFKENEMITTLTVKGITATRKYIVKH